jgi:hypothetical protein
VIDVKLKVKIPDGADGLEVKVSGLELIRELRTMTKSLTGKDLEPLVCLSVVAELIDEFVKAASDPEAAEGQVKRDKFPALQGPVKARGTRRAKGRTR